MMKWSIGLLGLLSLACMAEVLSESEVNTWLQEPTLVAQANQLSSLSLNGDLAAVEFQLSQLKYPQQEVLRTLLLSQLEQASIQLSPQLAKFVEQQMHIPTVYHIVEQGDGYEFSVPAFNYPSIAASMLKHWNKQQETMDFYMLAESGELDLKQWLSTDNKARELLFINQFEQLSKPTQQRLAEQIVELSKLAWVPSSRMVVKVAQVTQHQPVYQLLWKMKVDGVIERELANVAEQKRGDLLILAAGSSSLYPQAIDYMTRFTDPTDNVRQFLQAEIQRNDTQSLVENYFKANNNLKMLSTIQAP